MEIKLQIGDPLPKQILKDIWILKAHYMHGDGDMHEDEEFKFDKTSELQDAIKVVHIMSSDEYIRFTYNRKGKWPDEFVSEKLPDMDPLRVATIVDEFLKGDCTTGHDSYAQIMRYSVSFFNFDGEECGVSVEVNNV